MSKDAVILLVFALILFILSIIGAAYSYGYKQGQLDAISGDRVLYQLKRNPDGSRLWQELPKPTTRPAPSSGRTRDSRQSRLV